MFCERCPLQSFHINGYLHSIFSIYIFYILVILILTIFPPPSLFCAPGSIKNTLHYLEQQDVISLGQNQGKSCVAEPQHKSAVPRMAT